MPEAAGDVDSAAGEVVAAVAPVTAVAAYSSPRTPGGTEGASLDLAAAGAKAEGQEEDEGAKAEGQEEDEGAKAEGQEEDEGAKAEGQEEDEGAKNLAGTPPLVSGSCTASYIAAEAVACEESCHDVAAASHMHAGHMGV
jgi:nitrate reductase cytochrome c-type subunit